jgi:hypothetical protein
MSSRSLGSRTSGVDGSSEGGRINTIRLNQVLVIYGLPLLQDLRSRGYQGKADVEPALKDGAWVLKLRCEGDRPKDVPKIWHGHKVVLEMVKPKPPEAPKPRG